MGRYVRALPGKESRPPMETLQYTFLTNPRTHKTQRQEGEKKEWDIDPDRWRVLSFHKHMTLEAAKRGQNN